MQRNQFFQLDGFNGTARWTSQKVPRPSRIMKYQSTTSATVSSAPSTSRKPNKCQTVRIQTDALPCGIGHMLKSAVFEYHLFSPDASAAHHSQPTRQPAIAPVIFCENHIAVNKPFSPPPLKDGGRVVFVSDRLAIPTHFLLF